MTTRDKCAGMVILAFEMSFAFIEGLRLYFPDLATPEDTVHSKIVIKVMRKWTTCNPVSPEVIKLDKFYAVIWWAFKKSNYWPSRLETLDEVITK